MSENLYFAKRPGTRKVTQCVHHEQSGCWYSGNNSIEVRNNYIRAYNITNPRWFSFDQNYNDDFSRDWKPNHKYWLTFKFAACSRDQVSTDAAFRMLNNWDDEERWNHQVMHVGDRYGQFVTIGASFEPVEPLLYNIIFYPPSGSTWNVGDFITISDVMVLDLTADFGAGNEPTTVAECEAYYGPDYHPYGESYLDDWYAAYTNICKNLFNPAYLLNAEGWTMEDLSHYKGSIATLYNIYGESGYPFEKPWKPNTRYAFQCHIKVDVNDRSNNVRVVFYYTDGSSNSTVHVNSGDDLKITLISAAGKTVSRLSFAYSSYCTIHLSNIQVEEGDMITNPEPYRPSPIYKRVTQVYPVWDEDYWFGGLPGEPGLHIQCDEATGIYTTNGQIKDPNKYYCDLQNDWGANSLIDGHTYYLRMNSTCTQVINYQTMMNLSVASPDDNVNCTPTGQSKKIWTFHYNPDAYNYVILRTQGPKNIGGPAFIHNNETTRIEIFDLTIDFGPGNEPTTVEECEQYYGPDYVPFGSHEILSAYAFVGKE